MQMHNQMVSIKTLFKILTLPQSPILAKSSIKVMVLTSTKCITVRVQHPLGNTEYTNSITTISK